MSAIRFMRLDMEKFTETLTPDLLRKMDAYWRAANYLSVGQIYLYENPLLKRSLALSDVKHTLLGHCGTTPGQNFIYVHLNRIIKKYDLDMIYVSGPGHGGPAVVANTYLEGTYSEIYPNISQDEAVLTPSSLSCLSRPVPACIVFGEYSQHNQKAGALGEVFVERGGYWARPSYGLFYSSAGYFTLWEADGDTAPQVITVQNDCPNSGDSGQCADAKVYVQLFSLGVDNPKSCTKSVGAISLLPGHGTVLPPPADLRACPKSAG